MMREDQEFMIIRVCDLLIEWNANQAGWRFEFVFEQIDTVNRYTVGSHSDLMLMREWEHSYIASIQFTMYMVSKVFLVKIELEISEFWVFRSRDFFDFAIRI